VLGIIGDVFGTRTSKVIASQSGIVIGCTNVPLVNQGDAVVHIGGSRRRGERRTSVRPDD
jgi:predicted deacylase